MIILMADYSDMMGGWYYQPMWWNCQSFATRLAFLLVDTEYRDVIASLACDVQIQLVEWWICTRKERSKAVEKVASRAVLISSVGMVATAAVFPLYITCEVGFLAAMSLLGVHDFGTKYISPHMDAKGFKDFQVNMKQLESRFPPLKQLHSHINKVTERDLLPRHNLKKGAENSRFLRYDLGPLEDLYEVVLSKREST